MAGLICIVRDEIRLFALDQAHGAIGHVVTIRRADSGGTVWDQLLRAVGPKKAGTGRVDMKQPGPRQAAP
jgi:hypothetical protein